MNQRVSWVPRDVQGKDTGCGTGNVIRFFENRNVKLKRKLTDRAGEYCGNPEGMNYARDWVTRFDQAVL
jgi:hypothetical protein